MIAFGQVVAPPLAGGFGVGARTFLLYNGVGSALWALAGIALGWAFHTEVEWLLDALATLGNRAVTWLAVVVEIARDRQVVVYCACPNEVTAACNVEA